MTKYAFGQFALAFVVTAVGAVKAFRLVVDQIDDATTKWTGLR